MKAGYREVGIEREHFFREGRWHDHWVGEVLRADWERTRPA
jgi:RimJ/RimL family protein N-acetyltransferase